MPAPGSTSTTRITITGTTGAQERDPLLWLAGSAGLSAGQAAETDAAKCLVRALSRDPDPVMSAVRAAVVVNVCRNCMGFRPPCADARLAMEVFGAYPDWCGTYGKARRE